jgi:hypothetical protein
MDGNELQRLEREFSVAFTDTHHTINDLIGEGDRVVMSPVAPGSFGVLCVQADDAVSIVSH